MNIKKYKSWILIRKMLRYSIGGWLGAGINIFFLRFFTDVVGIYYIVSAILAFIISGISGFFFQKYIAFQDTNKKHARQLFLFLMFQWIGLLIDLLLLRLLVDKWWFYYLYVSIFNKWIVFIWNFIMNYLFTFYKNK